MEKMERLENRFQSIETRQTLTEAAWVRQGTVVEQINNRCMEKLGIKCPEFYEDEE